MFARSHFALTGQVAEQTEGLFPLAFMAATIVAGFSEMKLLRHKHFGMPGGIQKHTLVYIVVWAITLTILIDFSRIASYVRLSQISRQYIGSALEQPPHEQ